MAVKLPDGSKVYLANSYSTKLTTTAMTNAAPSIGTAASHTFVAGDFVELTSGWGGLNGKIFKVGAVTATTFELLGSDTTDTSRFPAGGGIGSVRKVLAWTEINQILEFSSEGGDQKFANFEFLDEDFERKIPTAISAQSIKISIADDPTLPGYIALKAAGASRSERSLRLRLLDASEIVYNGYASLNETPTTTKGQVMQVTATYSLSSRPNRY